MGNTGVSRRARPICHRTCPRWRTFARPRGRGTSRLLKNRHICGNASGIGPSAPLWRLADGAWFQGRDVRSTGRNRGNLQTRSTACHRRQRRGDEIEHIGQRGSQRGQRADRGNGDQGGDQTIFDGSDAGLVVEDSGQRFGEHDDLLLFWRRYSNTVEIL